MQDISTHRSLITDALHVYLSYSLKAALEWQTTERIFKRSMNISAREGYTTLLRELVEYLQESLSSVSSPKEVLGRLAVIDRLEEGVIAARVDALPSECAAPWGLYHHSALYLGYSLGVENKGDQELAKEWVLASQFCNSATWLWWTSDANAQELRYKETGSSDRTGRANLCFAIIQLLESLPELLGERSSSIVERYRFKRAVAECLYKQLRMQADALKMLRKEEDPRLRPLYEHQHRLSLATMAPLRALYTSGTTWSVEFSAADGALTSLRTLYETAISLRSTLSECGVALVNDAESSDCTMRYAALTAAKESLLNSLLSLHENGAMNDEATVRERTEEAQRLQDCAKTLQRDVHESLRTRTLYLAHLYRSRSMLPASAGTRSVYQQKVTDCWKRATALVSSENATVDEVYAAFQYSNPAEGNFASTVTCHTQWERAVQRRDDKLADFWQRARERAWEVGCEAFAQLANTGASSIINHHVGKAVCLVLDVQHLSQRQPPAPLAELELDLTLLTADVFLAYDDPKGKRLIPHLPGIHSTTRKVLSVVHTINQQGQLGLVGAADLIVDVQTRENLTWAAQTLRALFDFGFHRLGNEETTAVDVGLWRESVSNAHDVVAPHNGRGDERMALSMFVTDLHVMFLQAGHAGDAAGARVVAELRHLNRSVMWEVFNFADFFELGMFRNELAFVLEQALRDAYPEDRLLRLEQQWPAQRRCWLPTEPPSPVHAEIMDEMVAAKLRELHWQEMAALGAEPALRVRYQMTAASFREQWDRLFTLAERATEGTKAIEGVLSKEAVEVSAGAALTQADELACTAMEQGNNEALELCARAANVLKSLLNGSNEFTNPSRAEKAVEVIRASADGYMYAATAVLEGRCDVAQTWATAGALYGNAVRMDYGTDLDQRRRRSWEEALQSAEALAKQARRAEEALAEQARRAEEALAEQARRAEEEVAVPEVAVV
jgi:hypothetical protein